MEHVSTTDLIINISFSLGLLVCVWYFFIREPKDKQIDESFDDLTIKLDDYEKELSKITKYPKAKPTDNTDWKQWDRDNLDDNQFETLYQETKSGEKIIQFDMETGRRNYRDEVEFRGKDGNITTLNKLIENNSKEI